MKSVCLAKHVCMGEKKKKKKSERASFDGAESRILQAVQTVCLRHPLVQVEFSSAHFLFPFFASVCVFVFVFGSCVN